MNKVRKNKLIKPLARYGIALVGQISQSVFHFGLSLLLIKFLSPNDFGTYAMIFILLTFANRIGNALINIPLSTYYTDTKFTLLKQQQLFLFAKLNFLLSTIVGFLIGVIVYFWRDDVYLSISSGFLGTTFIWRNFARGINFTKQTPIGATKSDFSYALLGASVILFALLQPEIPITLPLVINVLSAASLFSLFFSGNHFIKLQFTQLNQIKIKYYARIWNLNSKWNLLNTVATELIANSPSYIMTALIGPYAYAPFAAAVVMFRPLNVIMTSLTSIEYPKLAKLSLLKDKQGMMMTSILYIGVLLIAWSLLLMFILFFWDVIYEKLFSNNYASHTVKTAVFLWAIIYFIKIFRTLLSLIIQSRRKFKELAILASITGGITAISMIFLLIYWGALYSLNGVIIGEMSFSLLMLYFLRK